MSSFLQLALTLAVILIAAKISAYLSTRLGQPAVLGELIIGLLLGPTLLDLLHLPFLTNTHLEGTVAELGELGVLMLMFIAGLELHFSELAKNTKVSALAGSLGVLIPVILGWALGLVLGLETEAAVFLGLTLGATSVSISAQTLMELKVLRTRVGLGLLGAAVFDDILVILLLSGFLAFQEGATGLGPILLIFGRMMLFLVVSTAFGYWLLPWLTRRVSRLPISQGIISLALVVMLVYGLAAELLGSMAAITGAFLAGLMFARTREKQTIETGMVALSYGLFVPVFFVSIGLAINLRELDVGALWMLLAILVVAIAGKLLGAGLGARLAGFSTRESLQLGTGMISRGEVGLIVASVGLNQNLVSQTEFSAIVGMVRFTTMLTPPALRFLFTLPEPKPAPEHPDTTEPEEAS